MVRLLDLYVAVNFQRLPRVHGVYEQNGTNDNDVRVTNQRWPPLTGSRYAQVYILA